MLAAELSHRVRNLLTVIQVVADRTADRAASIDQFLDAFRGRLQAINSAQGALIARDWRNASLSDLVHGALEPYLGEGSRIRLDLQDPPVGPELAFTLTLALHELATNAVKHGALSDPKGRVTLTARTEAGAAGEELCLVWQEDGGPPTRPPETTGFGTTLLGRAMQYQHQGRSELLWRENGLLCRLHLPLSAAISPAQA
jgi:two-component sensor histidine kinase